MKTTIDIADALAEEAKQVAPAEGSTLRSLAEGTEAWAIPGPASTSFWLS